MRFYSYWRSSAVWRCRIAFALKGIAPENLPVHLLRSGGEQKLPEFLARNPQGLVPALEVDGQVLTQSLAIIEWLDETYPAPALLPGDPFQRARIRAFALAIACEIHPFQNLRVQQYLTHELEQDQAAVQGWLTRWIGDGLAACETLLAARPSGQSFAFADTPTLADICLAPQLASATRFGIDISKFVRVGKLAQAYAAHPAFIAALPANQPDSEG